MTESQIKKIQNHLIRRGTITSWDAIQSYRVTRLAAIIFLLRKRGMDIKTNKKYTKTGQRFAVYVLMDKEVDTKKEWWKLF